MKKFKRTIIAASLVLFTAQSQAENTPFITNTFELFSPSLIGLDITLFEVSFSGLAPLQVAEIKNHVSLEFNNDALGDFYSDVESLESSIENYFNTSDETTYSEAALISLEQQTSDVLAHKIFQPITATQHETLTSLYTLAVGFRKLYLEESYIRRSTHSESELKASLNNLHSLLLNAGNETDSYIEPKVYIYSNKVTDCRVRASFCYDYYVRDNFEPQTFFYKYNEWGNSNYDQALNKEGSLELDYSNEFKGSRYQKSLDNLKALADSLSDD